MFEILSQLFGGKKREEAHDAPIAPRTGLRPTDAPVIQARLQGLDLLAGLPDAEAASLRRVVLERCRANHDEAWWGPLRAWTGLERCRLPVFLAEVQMGEPSHVALHDLGRLVPEFGLRPLRSEKIEGGEGLICGLDDQEVVLRLRVEDGVLNVRDLAQGLNAVASAHRWSFRFLLLTEDHGWFGLVRAPQDAAQRAARSGWGELAT